jgi:hypothetical protein
MLSEPRLLIPAFCVVLATALLGSSGARRRWREDPAVRFVAASATYLALITLVIFVWEFAFGGAALDVPYYFDLFSPGIAVTLGGCIGLVRRRVSTPRPVFLAAVAAAAIVPVVVAYKATPSAMFGRHGSILVVVLMVATLAALFLPRRALAPLVLVMLAVAAPACAAAGSISTKEVFGNEGASYSFNVRSLSLADQLVSFMRSHHLQSMARGAQPPVFWYDSAADPYLIGMQSMYLFGWTWVGLSMPKVDPGVVHLIHDRRPQTIVLLCQSPACAAGPAALHHAGFRLRPTATAELEATGHTVWVRAFALPRYAITNQRATFYDSAHSLSTLGFANARQDARFGDGLPAGWQSQAASASRGDGGVVVQTTRSRLSYQLVGPEVMLSPGTYHAVVAGRVVAGGVIVGILDTQADSWIAQQDYSARQRAFDRRTMAVGFTLSKPTAVRIILSNWAPVDATSRWIVRRAAIVGR